MIYEDYINQYWFSIIFSSDLILGEKGGDIRFLEWVIVIFINEIREDKERSEVTFDKVKDQSDQWRIIQQRAQAVAYLPPKEHSYDWYH